MVNEIKIFRADTESVVVTVTDESGNPFDLTGYTITLTVKKNHGDSDADAIMQQVGSSTNPTSGVGQVDLTYNQTDVPPGKYYYDIQINDGTSVVKTVVSSIFEVQKSYTDTVV